MTRSDKSDVDHFQKRILKVVDLGVPDLAAKGSRVRRNRRFEPMAQSLGEPCAGRKPARLPDHVVDDLVVQHRDIFGLR